MRTRTQTTRTDRAPWHHIGTGARLRPAPVAARDRRCGPHDRTARPLPRARCRPRGSSSVGRDWLSPIAACTRSRGATANPARREGGSTLRGACRDPLSRAALTHSGCGTKVAAQLNARLAPARRASQRGSHVSADVSDASRATREDRMSAANAANPGVRPRTRVRQRRRLSTPPAHRTHTHNAVGEGTKQRA